MKITYKYKNADGKIQTKVWEESIVWVGGEYINSEGKTLFALSVEYIFKIQPIEGAVSLMVEGRNATVKFAKRLIPFISSGRLLNMFEFTQNV